MNIGVLACREIFHYIQKCFNEKLVKSQCFSKITTDFDSINGLIIPGGESTVILKLLDKFNFYKPALNDFSLKRSLCLWNLCRCYNSWFHQSAMIIK